MKKKPRAWTVPVSGALLLATAVSAEQDLPMNQNQDARWDANRGVPPGQDLQIYQNSTNRLTGSLRFGLNISGKFKGMGSSFLTGANSGLGQRTPNGDPYNYDNGYVYPDISGSHDGLTYYWGYNDASQVNTVASTITFNRTTGAGLPADNSGDNSPYLGAEITYNYEFGVKEDWHHLHYGLEAAFNFMPIYFNGGGSYTLATQTDTYGYEPGTLPPPNELPYKGGRGPGAPGGNNFILNLNPSSSSTSTLGPFVAQEDFDATLWGFRLGPYIEYPFDQKWTLHLSGGLAVGLLDAEANWKETLTSAADNSTRTVSGGGSNADLLWGYYIGLNAAYQFNQRWGVEAGVQFQDLGTYSHNFGGRVAELDLSQSIFVHLGISYSF